MNRYRRQRILSSGNAASGRRAQLSAIAAASAAAAAAWGAVWLADDPVAAPPPAAPTASMPSPVDPADRGPDAPRANVPVDLRMEPLPSGRAGTPRGGLVGIDDVPNTPGAVGAATVCTLWTYDTTIDTSSHDAAARAAGWATSRLATTLSSPAVRTSPQWDRWEARDAYSTVAVSRAPVPGQDVETQATLRTYQVDVRVNGDRGYRDRFEPLLVTVTLVRDRGRWIADGIDLS